MTRASLMAALVVLSACGSGGGGTGGGAGGGTGGSASGGSTGGASGGGTGGGAATQFTLTIAITGGGRVISTPAGLDCTDGTAPCTASFASGTTVSLTAKARRGTIFGGFTGGCTGRTCSLSADASVTATFTLVSAGNNPAGVAVTPDGARAVVALNNTAGEVKVFSTADFSVLRTVSVDPNPSGVAITPDGSKALVTHLHSISIIDLTSYAVSKVQALCAGDTLYDIAVTPDGTKAILPVLSASCTANVVGVLDLGSSVLSAGPNLNTSNAPMGVAVASDSDTVLIAKGILGSSVFKVKLSTGSVTSIPNTSSTFGVAMGPSGEAWVSSGQGDTVKRLDVAAGTVTGAIAYGTNQRPHNLAVSRDGTYAVAAGDFDIGFLSLGDGGVETSGVGGNDVALTPDGGQALVTSGTYLRVFQLPYP